MKNNSRRMKMIEEPGQTLSTLRKLAVAMFIMGVSVGFVIGIFFITISNIIIGK